MTSAVNRDHPCVVTVPISCGYLPPCVLQINGFDVQDTEEALMMFLEQDPVITITVARACGVRTACHISLQHASLVDPNRLCWSMEHVCVCGGGGGG